ncbi:MAG: phospholipase D-like domain-containing protein [Polyangiales bacterium]
MKLRFLAGGLLVGAIGCGSAAQAPVAEEDDSGSSIEDTDVTMPVDAVTTDSAATDSTSMPDVAPVDAPATSTGTKLVVEPDDGDTPILSAIGSAKKSLHLEVYLLTDGSTINALKKAKSKGVDVQVILEQKPFGMAGANDSAQSSLTAAGIPVHWANDSLYALTHAKFMVIDGATLLVMTLNLSSSAFTSNREYAIFDPDPADVSEAEAMFAADASGKSILPTGSLVVSPTNSEKTLEALIDSAKSSLDIEVETLGDSKIDDRIIAAAGRGVNVRILVNDATSSTTASSVAALGAKGIKVRKLGTLNIHAKAIVVDSARVFVGSENLTTQSLAFNREVGVITATPAIVSRIQSTIAGDYAKGSAY